MNKKHELWNKSADVISNQSIPRITTIATIDVVGTKLQIIVQLKRTPGPQDIDRGITSTKYKSDAVTYWVMTWQQLLL